MTITAILTLSLLAACGPKAVEPEAIAVPDAEPDLDPEDVDEPAPAEPIRCGGIAGLRCPAGRTCVDDPTDSCVPGRGADCIGVCIADAEAPAAGRRRLHSDPAACKTLELDCTEEEVPFHDANGCGCEATEAEVY